MYMWVEFVLLHKTPDRLQKMRKGEDTVFFFICMLVFYWWMIYRYVALLLDLSEIDFWYIACCLTLSSCFWRQGERCVFMCVCGQGLTNNNLQHPCTRVYCAEGRGKDERTGVDCGVLFSHSLCHLSSDIIHVFMPGLFYSFPVPTVSSWSIFRVFDQF